MVKFIHTDILKNLVKLNTNEKITKLVESIYMGLKYPEKAEYVSYVGDLINLETLKKLRIKMKNDPNGKDILEKQPRIKDNFNLDNLKNLNKNSLGFKYYNFMNNNNFNSKDRPLVKYIDDYELAYINQRYKEIHDFIHILLNYEKINLLNEIKVKFFEMNHFGFPSGLLSSLSCIFLLNKQENADLISELNIINRKASKCKLLLNFNFEENFEKDFDLVLEDLNLNIN